MQLNVKVFGSGKPLVILHGLFGSLDNWQTHAKKFAEYFQVILVDQRNHGHSPWSDEMSYSLMAFDLKELLDSLSITKTILLGHSMGGKTVIQFAQIFPERIEKLIVVDIGIKAYPMHHQAIIAGIEAVSNGSRNSRSEAEGLLRYHIDSEGVVQFLSKNLFWKEKEILGWRMNVDVLKSKMHEILKEIDCSECWIPTLFLKGELSNYILAEDHSELEDVFPDITIITISNAGHWVHAEASEQFINEVLGFLLR
jgi:esterase